MGVKNLWDILESCKQTLPLHHLQNKRLCVDLSCWMIQFQTASRSLACVKEKIYLQNLFHRLRALIALNCSLIFVTDGSIPAIKLTTYRRRLGTTSEAVSQDETNAYMVPPLRRNMGSEFSCMIKDAKNLGMALGIPCLDGVEEAEAQCASLNSASLCDGCFTADSDIFLFGARTVYRDIFLGDSGYVVCYDMVDIERKLGFGRNSLITLALLLGSDYSQGVHGFGPETAVQIVKSIGDDVILHRIVSEGLTFSRKTKGTKKKGKAPNSDASKENDLEHAENICAGEQNLGSNDQFVQVINAYLKPKCHSPDSETVKRVCIHHPFGRTQLQQICTQFFGWDPDKTDRYILPKIAERDLRRFAYFRTTSSELGLRIPLQEMPVTCPVFAILKQRKLHGRECFEVSWQEVDGLKTSVVPADLVKCACPEKIAEFVERNAEGKKQKRKPRPRKSKKAALGEVDLKLRGLLLSIESENDPFSNPTMPCHSVGSNDVEPRVIDLLTPSPPLRACKMAKRQESIGCIDIINVSMFETDSPPEQERKSTESNAFNGSVSDETIGHHTDEISMSFPSACNAVEREESVSLGVDVIDLSPVLKHERTATDSSVCNAAECKETNVRRHIDVIDVCESETDSSSPEHQRKARELRLFIDSIKEDLY